MSICTLPQITTVFMLENGAYFKNDKYYSVKNIQADILIKLRYL